MIISQTKRVFCALECFLLFAKWWCYDKPIGQRASGKLNFKESCSPPGLMCLQKLGLAENHPKCWLLRGHVYVDFKDTVLVKLTDW